jgi:hypothetical protein
MRSRNQVKLAGVWNARLYVTRKFWVSFGLKMIAARGDVWTPSTWSFLSTRSAATKSHFGVRRVVDCTYPPTSVTSSMSSFLPLIVFPVRGLVEM